MAYKQDQGRYARLAAFWSLAILIFYGCTSLYTELASRFSGALKAPLIAAMPKVPVLGLSVNGEHRAYPIRYMSWHEMANDELGHGPS